ncbi:phosphoribosyl-AMP cyclohydrolase [Salinispira pacifica]|uniref:Histidine biosynthesis bifunctional protein HisIE n=1 Tax=Salinispira pacifica TaxID=1307761 RepID=V5WIP8_9SPIO|nr:phosphoribosyl-AMP cyclohydrolase [Salinispira pacifica]AHC15712.1 Phosphoribosyl-AMP cyclohydrolase [Salinispira pacifica]
MKEDQLKSPQASRPTPSDPKPSDLEEGREFHPDFPKRGGLLPCIVQDAGSREVLMLGYVTPEALEKTISTGLATFYSTSRKKLWTKGEESGNIMKVGEIRTDCDQDALIYLVEPDGDGACHTRDPQSGKHRYSCFYRRLSDADNTDNIDNTGRSDNTEKGGMETRDLRPGENRKSLEDRPAVKLEFIRRPSR